MPDVHPGKVGTTGLTQTACIGKGTLDEAPFAYRSIEEITEA